MIEQQAERPFISSRFEILHRLGSGGMGVVYEARDRLHGNIVALKTLADVEPEALLRFKSEFRALQDLHHPNLVQLYELIEEAGNWFFTMELVRGVSFLEYTRPGGEDPESAQTFDREAATTDMSRRRKATIVSDIPRGGSTFDEVRLRRTLAEIAAALSALHAARKVHCDVKPNNVLVNDERAVLIDFGILLDAAQIGAGPVKVIGTPAFMAPEQAAMRKVGPAADWYALGGILYLALTGRVPFAGRTEDVLEMKQRSEPTPPDVLVPGLPRDLVRLCVELLALDPASRPRGPDIVQRLHGTPLLSGTPPAFGAERFVGRAQELELLRSAFLSTEKEGLAVVLHGEAGIGKSALVSHFATRLDSEGSARVLVGRCDQRETVPFKALDEVFDALSRDLAASLSGETTELLPPRADLLAATFPTLRRIPSFERAAKLTIPLDARRTRDLVFSAARELASRLARTQPLCIIIDDLQWADADSLSLILELMRPPAPAHVLLVATLRTTPEARGRLDDLTAALGTGLRLIEIEPLPHRDALSLAAQLVGAPAAATIIEETGGHPLFIDALARCQIAPGSKSEATLDNALWARALATSPAAREVLSLLALTAEPLISLVLATAARMTLEASMYAVAELRALRLVRVGDAGVQPYHDLVRRAVLAHVTREETASRHAALAAALEQHGAGQPETLAIHLMGSGQHARALGPALVAAEQASRALAFDRAARLYMLVLELLPEGDPRRRDVHVTRGQALANAGRGAEAARVFLEAADLADEGALELRRYAAELYLTSGHIDEGLATLELVLGPMGMKMPASPTAALLSLLWRRGSIRLRGLRGLSHMRDSIPPAEATRIDTCWSVAAGLGLVDTIRGADFQARHMQVALTKGDPVRVARALAAEACYASTVGISVAARTAKLLDTADELATRLGDSRAMGFVQGARGIVAFQQGRYREARDLCAVAEDILRERCQGVAWELTTALYFRLAALALLGQFASLNAALPLVLREAEDRGDLYGLIGLQTSLTNMAWLAADTPDEAERQVLDGMRRWSRRGYQIQHYQAWFANVQILLYRGKGQKAYALVEQGWKPLASSFFLRIQFIRTMANGVVGRTALAASATCPPSERARLIAIARRATSKLEREDARWANAVAQSLRGQIAVAEGRRDEAIKAFAAATEALSAADLHLDAACARRARGLLLGGEEGRAEIARAEGWMASERIRAFRPTFAMIIPAVEIG
jgi:serine/threonine protein kinase/tetratricopeptide (TPR) repeat protein